MRVQNAPKQKNNGVIFSTRVSFPRYSDFKRCDRVYQDIKYIFSIFDHPDVQALQPLLSCQALKEDRKEELERLVLTIERRLYTSESKLTSAIASVQNFNRGPKKRFGRIGADLKEVKVQLLVIDSVSKIVKKNTSSVTEPVEDEKAVDGQEIHQGDAEESVDESQVSVSGESRIHVL